MNLAARGVAALLLGLAALTSADPLNVDNCHDFAAIGDCTLPLGTPAVTGDQGSTKIVLGAGDKLFIALRSLAGAERLQIVATTDYGQPMMYATKGTDKQPSSLQFDEASAGSVDQNLILVTDTVDTAYNVMITAQRATAFSLVAFSQATVTRLQTGLRQHAFAVHRGYEYFSFDLGNSRPTGPVTVTLTAMEGDPDLLCAVDTSVLPTIFNTPEGMKSRDTGADRVQIAQDKLQRDGNVTIGVYGFSAGSFSLLVEYGDGTEILLSSGEPLFQQLSAGQSRYYGLLVPAGKQAVTIDVSPLVGDPDVFVLSAAGVDDVPAYPSPTHKYWSSQEGSNRRDIIRIPTSDQHALSGGGVYAITVTALTDTSFTITGSTADEAIRLDNNQPMTGIANTADYTYYSVRLNSTNNVAITLTPFGGDPDMYIACSLNATHTDEGFPSRKAGHHVGASETMGRDHVVIGAGAAVACPVPAGAQAVEYYIAVYAYQEDAYFSILASLDQPGQVKVLRSGEPQFGVVAQGERSHFVLTVPHASDDITFSITPAYGDPDMYVAFDTNMPDTTHYAYKASGSAGVDVLEIEHGATQCNQPPCACTSSPCKAYVTVVGFQESLFSIVGSSTGTSITLIDGQAVTDVVDQGAYSYFVFELVDSARLLTFTLTPLNGDPDLLVSTVVREPTLADIANATAKTRGALSFIGNDELNYTMPERGSYFVGVYGSRASRFTLLAHATGGAVPSDDLARLSPGVPQSGVVPFLGYTYYQLLAGQDTSMKFDVTASPSAGLVEVVANRCPSDNSRTCSHFKPTKGNATFDSGARLSDATVTVDGAAAGGSYVIGVFGLTAASFQVSAVGTSSVRPLTEGVAEQGAVGASSYSYYVFMQGEVGNDAYFSLTPSSGDPDMFVNICGGDTGKDPSSDACERQPTRDKHDAAAVSTGVDVIFVPTTGTPACNPQAGKPCAFYIGVYGAQNMDATFNVLASVHSDRYTVLQEGRPISNAVERLVTDRYVFVQRAGVEEVTVSVDASVGDADLYITLVNMTANAADIPVPGPNDKDYGASTVGASDSILVRRSDAVFEAKCGTADCGLLIGVRGWSNAAYTITASSQGHVITLVTDQVFRDTIPAGAAGGHYRVAISTPDVLVVGVTPIGTCDPDLYVATFSDPLPSSHNSTWQSIGIGGDLVEIYPYPGDKHACQHLPCFYYITVESYGQVECTVDINARLKNGLPTTLTAGQPVTSNVEPQETDLYVLRVASDVAYEHIEVHLTPVTGDADLYITLDGSIPTTTHHDYYSSAAGGEDLVVIHKTDPAFVNKCAGKDVCMVTIAVRGFTVDCSYSLLAVTDAGAAELTDGVPLTDSVLQGQTDRYTYTVSALHPDSTVTISVDAISGDPDLYVTTDGSEPVGPHHYERKSVGWGREVVELRPGEKGFCSDFPCTYYIGVHGYDNSTFVIRASESANSTSVLIDGNSAFGLVMAKEMNEYAFTVVMASAKTTDILLSPITGDPDLYVRIGGDSPVSMSNYDYRAVSALDADEIAVSITDPKYGERCAGQATCTLRIGVYGHTTSLYLVTASNLRSILLQEGVPMEGNIDAGEYQYYRFQTTNPNSAIVFELTVLAGDPDMYISANPANPTPNATWSDFRSTGYAAEVVEVYPFDPKACHRASQFQPCNYWIGVTGFRSPASFRITAKTHTTDFSTLVDGSPQTGFLNHTQQAYYLARFPAGQTELTLSVSPLYGDPDVYAAFADPGSGFRVGTTTANYTAQSAAGQELLTIRSTDAAYTQFCTTYPGLQTEGCPLQVMVKAFSDTQFSIVSTTSGGDNDNTEQLEAGKSVEGVVDAHQMRYYKFRHVQNKVLTVTLTTLTGDPDLYVSAGSRPDRIHANWSSTSTGNETITIQPDDPLACTPPCTYFIGVYGWREPSNYRLVAYDGYPLLSDCEPAQGSASVHEFAYFVFYLPNTMGGRRDVMFQATASSGVMQMFVEHLTSVDNGPIPVPHQVCTDPSDPSTCSVVNSDYNTEEGSQLSITLLSDNGAAQPGWYVIGIQSRSIFVGASFTVTACTSNGAVTLRNGIYQRGAVAAQDYSYFRCLVPSTGTDAQISLSQISGASSLYVSYHPDNTRPTAGSYDLTSSGHAGNTVTVPEADLADVCHTGGGGEEASDCNVAIGVFGNTESTFSIVCQTNTSSCTSLSFGQTIQQSVAAGEHYLFCTHVALADGATYQVTVQPLGGNPDLFVTTDGSQPSRLNWNYQSQHSGGEDSVEIEPCTDPNSQYCHYMHNGMLKIAVYGYGGPATFTVTVQQTGAPDDSPATPLLSGVPFAGNAQAGTYTYYSIDVGAAADTLAVELTQFSGSSSAFMSVAAGQGPTRPTSTNHQYASVNGHMTVADAGTHCTGGSVGCSYIVGVKCGADTPWCRWTITATVSGGGDDTPVVRLVDSRPETGSVESGKYSYFSFDAGAGFEFVVITATPQFGGSIAMFASNTYYPNVPGSALPNSTDYIWSDQDDGNGEPGMLVIAPNDPNWGFGTLLTVAVQGTAGTGTATPFTVTARSGEVAVELQFDTPSPESTIVQAGVQRWYLDVQDMSADLVMTLSALSGDPDLLVSRRSQFPGCETDPYGRRTFGNFTWRSVHYGDDTIVIDAKDPCASADPAAPEPCVASEDWVPGRFYIGICGFQRSTYSLLAIENGVNVPSGRSVTSVASQGLVRYMRHDVAYQPTMPDVLFELRKVDRAGELSQGVPISYYLSSCRQGECTDEDMHPTRDTAAKIGIIGAAAGDFVVTASDGDTYCQRTEGSVCSYYIGIETVCDSRRMAELLTEVHLEARTSAGVAASYDYAELAALYGAQRRLAERESGNTAAVDPEWWGSEDPVGAAPDDDAPLGTCSQRFTFQALDQTGDAPTRMAYSDVKDQVSMVSGSVAAGAAREYEVYLNSSTTQEVRMRLDACGPGDLAVYVCDPTATGDKLCENSFHPSEQSHSYAAYTAGGGQAVAAVTVPATQAPTLYAAVQLPGASSVRTVALPLAPGTSGPRHLALDSADARRLSGSLQQLSTFRDADGESQFQFQAATGLSYELVAPAHATLRLVQSAGASVNVTWDEPVLIHHAESGPVELGPALGATYTVYAAAGDFGDGYVSTTACGLERWSGRTDAITTETNRNEAVVVGLAAQTDYQLNVRAVCSSECFAASIARYNRVLGGGLPELVGQRAVEAQAVAMFVTTVNSGAAPPPSKPDVRGPLRPGDIAAIVIIVVALVGGLAGYWLYQRRRASQTQTQYSMLELGDQAMDTLPQRDGEYTRLDEY